MKDIENATENAASKLVISQVAAITSRLLFRWKLWYDERNLAAGTETAFVESLKDRGYEQQRKTSAKGFKGIGVYVPSW